ncbi:hypothetical protein C1S80_23240 [Mycolicibacterium aubagnense]|nr:hypothetical protein C1S80_23240 [Mycolicibacterium aubagnense]
MGAGCPGTAGAVVGWADSEPGAVFGAAPPGSSSVGTSIPAPILVPGATVGSVGLGVRPAPIRYRILLEVSRFALLGLSPNALPGKPSAFMAGSTLTAARTPRASYAAGGGLVIQLGAKE